MAMNKFLQRGLGHRGSSLDEKLLRQLIGQNCDAGHSQGRPFVEHLRGTRRVLAAWGQPTVLQLAGLCHSIYSTDAFGLSSLDLHHRGRLRLAIGIEAEHLVFLFCGVKRKPFFRAIVRATLMDASTNLFVEMREGFGEIKQEISGVQAKQLLLIHLANYAEQAGSAVALEPWLEQFRRMAILLCQKAPDAIPSVLRQVCSIDRYSESLAFTAYLRATRLSSKPEAAGSSMEEVVRLIPFIAEPHVWLAWYAARRGDHFDCKKHAHAAYEKAIAFGVVWDKRLVFDVWLGLAQSLSKGSIDVALAENLQRLLGSANGGDTTEHNYKEGGRFETYLLNIASARTERIAGFFPGLGSDPFWPSEGIQLAKDLRNQFEKIRNEVAALDACEFHDEAESIQRTGKWQVFMLLEAGRWRESNLARLPTVSAILQNSEEVRRAGGLIYISRLSPGTVVAPHAGPTNMRLRLHFGLRIPKGDCAMRVGGLTRYWEEAGSVVLNDFLEHEVWNHTEEDRLILLVDIWHPDINPYERQLLEAVHRIAQQQSQGLLAYWEANNTARQRSEIQPDLQERSQKFDDLVL
jgi:hypothetical protein